MLINREALTRRPLRCEASYPELGVGRFSFLSFASDFRGVVIAAAGHIERVTGGRPDVNRIVAGVR